MRTLIRQLLRIFAWLSQGVNAIFFAGHQNQTLSARSYVNRNMSSFWSFMYTVINWIFFWQEDHCYESHLQDVEWSKEYISYYKNTDTNI